MKLCFSVMLAFVALSSSIAQEAQGCKWDFHREVLKQRLDTTYWKTYWEDELWHIRAIFVDMDGDGLEEMMAITTSEEDRMGDYWKIWKQDDSGKFRQVFFSGDIYFSCHSESFYKLTCLDKSNIVVGLGMNANIEENCGNGDRRIVRPTPDCKFVLMPENKFMLSEIRQDIDTLFGRDDVVSIERLYPEWYFGYDFTPPPDEPRFASFMPYKLPQGDLRRGGGMSAPDDFAAFAAEHCLDVETRTGKSATVAYAVFLDADNDGDADCYVSSDAEAEAGETFYWTLYLWMGTQFEKAEKPVCPLPDKKNTHDLPVSVTAGRSSFCRVVRYEQDPTYIVLDTSNAPKTNVRNMVLTDSRFHRIEKLTCWEFPFIPSPLFGKHNEQSTLSIKRTRTTP